MTTSPILANIDRGWGRGPSDSLSGTDATGVSIALWEYNRNDPLELDGITDHHLVTVQLQPTGRVEFASGNRRKIRGPLPAYACDLTQAGERSTALIRGPIKTLQFYIPTTYITRLLESEAVAPSSGSVEFEDLLGTPDAQIARISREAANELRRVQPFSRLRIDALAQELSIHLLRNYSNVASNETFARDRQTGGLAAWQIRILENHLEERLSSEVSICDMARFVGLSNFHFCRAFKKTTGVPPYRWFLMKRIERAKSLLTATDRRVTEIALACGFSSSQHFAAAFNKIAGVTPTQFRSSTRW